VGPSNTGTDLDAIIPEACPGSLQSSDRGRSLGIMLQPMRNVRSSIHPVASETGTLERTTSPTLRPCAQFCSTAELRLQQLVETDRLCSYRPGRSPHVGFRGTEKRKNWTGTRRKLCYTIFNTSRLTTSWQGYAICLPGG
jgi:hypothetical protein